MITSITTLAILTFIFMINLAIEEGKFDRIIELAKKPIKFKYLNLAIDKIYNVKTKLNDIITNFLIEYMLLDLKQFIKFNWTRL